MSGVEIVGLVLPLLLSAVENWDACIRPFVRYRKFEREAKDYHEGIEIQRTIFRNECRFMLEGVIEHDAVSGMLESPAHKDWRSHLVGGKLNQLLGDSVQGCLSIIRTINQKLEDILEDSHEFSLIMDKERKVMIIPMSFA